MKNSKYSFLIEIETQDSLITQEIKAILGFLSELYKQEIKTEFYSKINVYDVKAKYLGERY